MTANGIRTYRFAPRRLREAAGTIVWLCCVAVAPAQEPLDEADWQRGYHAFAALCRAHDFEPPLDGQAWDAVPPRKKLLVVFGGAERHLEIAAFVNAGGAVLFASDRDDLGALQGLGLSTYAGPYEAADRDAAFRGYRDCPVVTRFERGHPLTEGLTALPTNRPGALIRRGSLSQTLARLPRLRGLPTIDARGISFLAAVETSAGGRAVVVSDSSVFTNQMLFFGDNARLATNALSWLGEGRTEILILDDAAVIAPPSPQLVMVELPPPTAREVRAALRSLPPEMLVEFANVVVATAEDEGIVNEFVAFLLSRVSRRNYYRLVVLAATVVLGAVALRRLAGSRAIDDGTGGKGDAALRAGFHERRAAAAVLLESFRTEVAGTPETPWKSFASGLRLAGRPWQTWMLRRILRTASRRIGPDGGRYWNRRRLRWLDERVRRWREEHAAGSLEYRS